MREGAQVVIVDDDESVREALPDLVRQLGYAARAFASAEEFLASDALSTADCLILDIGLPGMSGPDLQRELTRRGCAIPTVLITARSGDSVPPNPPGKGAVACVFKPFSDDDLQAALELAFRGDD